GLVAFRRIAICHRTGSRDRWWLECELAEQRARRCPVAFEHLDWQAAKFVTPGKNLREIQSLNHPNSGAQQRMVGLNAVLPETSNRKVIDSHGHDLRLRKKRRCFFGDVNEVFVELVSFPRSF